MNSETPKDSASSSNDGDTRANRSNDRDTPGSLGLEMLEPHQVGHDGSSIMVNSGGDEPNYLMPHERKLSLSEQRQLLMGRRHLDDDPEEIEEDVEVRRGRGRGLMTEFFHGKEHGADTHHTAHGKHPLLSDAAHPHKPLYDTVLHGVGHLDASKVSLSGAEQANVAGALTASMTQTPGFHRGNPELASISIAASENGDRIFAINSQNPGAPTAIHTSVDVELARGQSLSASSAQALAVPSPAPELPKPAQEQTLPPEQQSPRVIV